MMFAYFYTLDEVHGFNEPRVQHGQPGQHGQHGQPGQNGQQGQQSQPFNFQKFTETLKETLWGMAEALWLVDDDP